MQFGIRSVLFITAIYAGLFAIMRPFGALGIAAAVFPGTAFGALMIFDKTTITRLERAGLLLLTAAPPALVLSCNAQVAIWVGHTNLMVEFTVSDAETGEPIPAARVEVQQAEGGFRDDHDKREFVLVADSAGVIGRECPGTTCTGRSNNLGSVDTFDAYLPQWRFRALAEGFETGEWIELNALQRQGKARAQRTGRGKSRVVLPVSLRKRRANPGKAQPTNVRS